MVFFPFLSRLVLLYQLLAKLDSLSGTWRHTRSAQSELGLQRSEQASRHDVLSDGLLLYAALDVHV